jgi:hypothetical protein
MVQRIESRPPSDWSCGTDCNVTARLSEVHVTDKVRPVTSPWQMRSWEAISSINTCLAVPLKGDRGQEAATAVMLHAVVWSVIHESLLSLLQKGKYLQDTSIAAVCNHAKRHQRAFTSALFLQPSQGRPYIAAGGPCTRRNTQFVLKCLPPICSPHGRCDTRIGMYL